MIKGKIVLLALIIAVVPTLGFTQKKKIIIQPKNTSFSLAVNVNVPNSRIYINNKEIAGNRVKLPQGNYNILVRANGYSDWNSTVFVNRNMTINANLVPLIRNYNLSITSNVPNSQIFINNKQVSSGGYNSSLPEGNYSVEVRANGYLTYFSNVYLDRNMNLSANLQPIPSVTVNVVIPSSMMNSTRVFANGQYMPGLSFTLMPGNNNIRIEMGSLSTEKTYNFSSGRTYTIEPVLDISIR